MKPRITEVCVGDIRVKLDRDFSDHADAITICAFEGNDLIVVFTREEAEGLAGAIITIARQEWPDEDEGEDVE